MKKKMYLLFCTFERKTPGSNLLSIKCATMQDTKLLRITSKVKLLINNTHFKKISCDNENYKINIIIIIIGNNIL